MTKGGSPKILRRPLQHIYPLEVCYETPDKNPTSIEASQDATCGEPDNPLVNGTGYCQQPWAETTCPQDCYSCPWLHSRLCDWGLMQCLCWTVPVKQGEDVLDFYCFLLFITHSPFLFFWRYYYTPSMWLWLWHRLLLNCQCRCVSTESRLIANNTVYWPS